MRPPRRPSAIGPCGVAAAMLCTLAISGCSSGRKNLDQPPDARGIVIAHRALLWRNLESIRNAAIAPPKHMAGLWRVCVRMNIRSTFGDATSPRQYLVALYGVAKPPEFLMEDAAAACAGQPYSPFPELEGGYQTDQLMRRGTARKP